jgi:hypothetical protein
MSRVVAASGAIVRMFVLRNHGPMDAAREVRARDAGGAQTGSFSAEGLT